MIETESDGAVTAVAAGGPVTTAVVQDALLETLVQAFAVTLVVILVFLTILYWVRHRKPAFGVLTLAPVVAALAWLLGTMAVLDVPFNSETAVITSLAIGSASTTASTSASASSTNASARATQRQSGRWRTREYSPCDDHRHRWRAVGECVDDGGGLWGACARAGPAAAALRSRDWPEHHLCVRRLHDGVAVSARVARAGARSVRLM